jgi:O-antigen ligase
MDRFGKFKFLWLALGLSFSLFSVELFRWNVPGIGKIAFPMVLFPLIFIFGIISRIFRNQELPNPLYDLGVLLSGSLLLFLLWHFVSVIFLNGLYSEIHNIVKLFYSLFCMVVVVSFFPKEKKFLETFWRCVAWSSAVVMGILIYRYAFVLKVSFVSINWDIPSASGRNQLTLYLVFVIPFSLFLFLYKRRWLVDGIPLIILLFTLAFSGSRGGVVALLGGLVVGVTVNGIRGRINLLKSLMIFMLVGTLVGFLWWTFNKTLDRPALQHRLMSLSLDKLDYLKDEQRWDILNQGWEDFVSSPIVGIGLGNNKSMNKIYSKISHNDYLQILAELGILGMILFASILIIIGVRVFYAKTVPVARDQFWVIMSGEVMLACVLVRLLFVNAYYTPILWVCLGLVLIPAKLQENHQGKMDINEKEGFVSIRGWVSKGIMGEIVETKNPIIR